MIITELDEIDSFYIGECRCGREMTFPFALGRASCSKLGLPHMTGANMTAERGPRSENIPVHHGQGELRVRTYFPYSAVSVEYITTGRDANLGAALSFDLTFREAKALRRALKIHLDRSKHDDLDG